MKGLQTNRRIVDAAVHLFNTKGYSGTSVREIAKRAKVNVALISYYFNGKQGLLEQLMSSFFDEYIEQLEKAVQLSDRATIRHCVHKAIFDLLSYQQMNSQLARLVHRETTIDSVLIREVTTLYLRKEKYYWNKLLQKGMQSGEFKEQPVDLLIIQMKSMLTMPFINPHYLQEIFQVSPSDDYFTRRYSARLQNWIDDSISKTEKLPVASKSELVHFSASI